MPVQTARELAGAAWLLPGCVIGVLHDVLRVSAASAWSAVADSPGRRGNAAKREQAKRDQKEAWRLSELLSYPLDATGRCRQHRQPCCYCQLDEVPALGVDGWRFVAVAAPRWTGSAADLFAVAAGVAAGELALDMGAWRAWACTEHWLRLLREAKDREDAASRRARYGVRKADGLWERGSATTDADWREAEALRRRHLQLQLEVLQHEQVLRLDPPSIVTLTRLVDMGRSLSQALTEQAGRR